LPILASLPPFGGMLSLPLNTCASAFQRLLYLRTQPLTRC
jgi:hypothetical protein